MSKYRKDVPTVIGNPARVIAQPKTRRWIYGIAIAAVPLLVAYGVIAESDAALWIGLAGAVLGTGVPALAAANTPTDEQTLAENVRHSQGGDG